MVVAAVFSVLNKICDVAPELLIGVAVDVVVNADESLVERITGIEARTSQLYALAAVTVLVWVL